MPYPLQLQGGANWQQLAHNSFLIFVFSAMRRSIPQGQSSTTTAAYSPANRQTSKYRQPQEFSSSFSAAPPAAAGVTRGARRSRTPGLNATAFGTSVADIDPIAGRVHCEIQTAPYLEEITGRVEESVAQVQTDPFIDRPSRPEFVPSKQGIDKSTQIEAGDLFDFDTEVEPILALLVGSTLKQAFAEACAEAELVEMRRSRDRIERRRALAAAETRRLEEAERRLLEEKEARRLQEHQRLEREARAARLADAAKFASDYVRGLGDAVIDELDQQGFFYDPIEHDMEMDVLPWLDGQVLDVLARRAAAEKVVEAIVRAAAAKRLAAISALSAATPAAVPTPSAE
jgi:hypothetical protein